jgi:hypothetical protein
MVTVAPPPADTEEGETEVTSEATGDRPGTSGSVAVVVEAEDTVEVGAEDATAGATPVAGVLGALGDGPEAPEDDSSPRTFAET